MIDPGLDDLVLLYLESRAADPDGDRYARSTPGIAEAIGVAETVADRVALLSALSGLRTDGLIEESTAPVDGLAGERSVYRLTDAGAARAAELAATYVDEPVVVRDGDETVERRLGALASSRDLSLVGALSKLTPSGEFALEEALEPGFVDREEELATLESALSDAEAGRPRAAFVAGEPGVGKTALVDRLVDRASAREFETLVGRCRSDGGGPYHPFVDAFREAIDGGDRPPLFDDDELPEAADEQSYEAGVADLFARVADRLEARASERPVVLVVEDLQWIDAASRSLLAFLLESIDEAHLAVVATVRPSAREAADPATPLVRAAGDRAVRIDLEPLDPAAVAELIERRVGRRGVPPACIDAIADHAGGNPLFVVETVDQLLDDATIDPRHGEYPDRAADLSLPDVVSTTVRRRLDRLDASTRAVLEAGAVVGDAVPFALLSAACDRPDHRLREHADLLVDGRVWTRDDGTTYRFSSSVVRSTVLDELDPERRRTAERRVADALAAADDADHGTIARHYERAGDRERALEHALRAGEAATSVYAHEVAVDRYEWALSLARELGRDDAVLEALEALGDVHYTRGNYDDADKHFRYIRERTDDPELIRRTYRYQARTRFDIGEYDETESLANRGLAVGDEDAVTDEVCWLHDYRAGSWFHRGDLDEAIEGFSTERELATRLGNDLLLGRSLMNLGDCYSNRGDAERAIDLLERAVSILEGVEDRRELATCLNDLGITYGTVGEFDAAKSTLRRCRDSAEAIGDVQSRLSALNNLGVLAQIRGEWDEARECYAEIRRVAGRIGDEKSIGYALANEGAIAVEVATLEEAFEKVERAVETSRELDQKYITAQQLVGLGRVYLLSGSIDRAIDRAEAGLEIALENEYPETVAFGRQIRGRARRERGEIDAAIDDHREALSTALETGSEITIAQCRRELAETLLAADEHAEALKLVRTARRELPEQYRLVHLALQVTLGAVHRGRGEEGTAREALTTALELDSSPSNQIEMRARRELASLEREVGTVDAAREHARAGRSIAIETGTALYRRSFEEVLREEGSGSIDADSADATTSPRGE